MYSKSIAEEKECALFTSKLLHIVGPMIWTDVKRKDTNFTDYIFSYH